MVAYEDDAYPTSNLGLEKSREVPNAYNCWKLLCGQNSAIQQRPYKSLIDYLQWNSIYDIIDSLIVTEYSLPQLSIIEYTNETKPLVK